MDSIRKAIEMLEENGQFTSDYQPHKLFGGYTGYWEAHIKPDWLMIWKIIPEEQEIWLARTGTHADLF
jgi:mRNA interferase YafQ